MAKEANIRSYIFFIVLVMPLWGLLSFSVNYLGTTMLRKINRANQCIASKWIGYTNYHLIFANILCAIVFYLSCKLK